VDNPTYGNGPTKVIREQFTDPLVDRYTVLDNLRAAIFDLRRLPGSRENSLAITKVEEAIMWLEKA
jgi:hypothetical protein